MTRRRLLLGSVACLLLAACRSTPPPPSKPVTPEQARYLESRERMLKKFGRPGFELVVDAMKGQEFLGVEFFPVDARYSFYRAGGQTLRSRAKMVLSQPVPERARIIWRDSSDRRFIQGVGSRYVGNIIGDELIEVGSRIPQELIDDLERDPRGNLRLKFRMSEQGTLFGWDIERRPGYDPKAAQRAVKQLKPYPHVRPAYSFVGGDFREATYTDNVVDGRVVRTHHKGWYIDKRTGQKVETDY